MFVQVGINLILIILFLFIAIVYFHKPIHQMNLQQKLVIGVVQGFCGILSINLGLEVEENIILDLRSLVMILSAFYGGLPASIVTSIILGVYRLFLVNGLNDFSLIGTISILLTGLGLGIISKFTHQFTLRWTYLIGYAILISSSTYIIVLQEEKGLTITYLSLALLFASVFSILVHNILTSFKSNKGINSVTTTLIGTFGAIDNDMTYRKALEEVTHLLQCEYGSIMIKDGKYKVHCIYENGRYEITNQIVNLKDVEVIKYIEKGKSVVYQNWYEKRPYGKLEEKLYREGVRSSLHIPLQYKSKVIASINIYSKGSYHLNKKHLQIINQIFPFISFGFGLLDSENKFNTVTKTSNDAIILADNHMRITSWNEGAEKIFGFTQDEAIGQNVDMIIPEKYRQAHYHGVERFLSVKKPIIMGKPTELEGVRKDGSFFPLELSLNKWETSGVIYFGSIIRDISERKEVELKLKKANEILKKISNLDALTNIANRRYFEEQFHKIWEHCENSSSPISLIMLDIDYYKQYNDTYGHLSGDTCLIEVAQTLSQIRLGQHDFAARYGGEEFVIILAEKDELQAKEVAHSLKELVAGLKIPHKASPISDIVTISIGLATVIPNQVLEPKDLIQNADHALYEAKEKGRDTIVQYNMMKS